jgi:signal transduction histidine kinase
MSSLIATERNLTPLAFRIVAWAAMTAYTVYTAPSLVTRVAAGVLMGVGAVALQFGRVRDRRLRRAAFLIATIGGLAASFAAHEGLAPILAAVAAARLPDAFEGRWVLAVTVVDAVAFGATVAYISGSPAGALAGLGIPLLVQRELEHQELIRQRDRAQALLAEAQHAREAEAQTAALRERGRIARDMHDVLAHSLAGLSLQLQAARAVAAREHVPQIVLEPLDKAAALAREGLAEARAAVGALRDPTGLGLDALPALVERHPGEATLTVHGEPAQLDGEAAHAVYRAVQEALTNAARYAPGSPVSVELAWDPTELTVLVRDTGPAPGREAVTGQGSGLGLAGMGERMKQTGGTLRAGPRAGGGWEVRLRVPVATSVPVPQP